MEVKVQQMVALDEEAFDEVLVKYLRDKIESAEAEECRYGPHPYVVQAMQVVHDWFAYPDEWYFTSEEMEKAQAKFDKKKAKTKK